MDKNLSIEKKVVLKKTVKFYILPFISIGLFIGIIVVLVLPKISDIFSSLDKISSLSATSQEKSETIKKLDELTQKSNLIFARLNIINDTAPTGDTEVVTFRDKITSLIQKNSLVVVSQRLSESDINKNSSSINTIGLSLLEIPFFFEIRGSYENMVKFIDDLSGIDDFVIVREMLLSSGVENGMQINTLKLRIDKYQFNVLNQDLLTSQYGAVPIESQINDVVLQYIESKIQQ